MSNNITSFRNAPKPCIAVIEWMDGDDPEVLVAGSRLAVMRKTIDAIQQCHEARGVITTGIDLSAFLNKHPWPDDDKLETWLHALREDSTVPWVTLVDLDSGLLVDDLDTTSNASRQHYIDTGRYLWQGETP